MGRSLISGFIGFLAWELFKFFLATASDGMPRAVKRASKSWLPSTPGRLGYGDDSGREIQEKQEPTELRG